MVRDPSALVLLLFCSVQSMSSAVHEGANSMTVEKTITPQNCRGTQGAENTIITSLTQEDN